MSALQIPNKESAYRETRVFVNIRRKVLFPEPFGPCTKPIKGLPDWAATVESSRLFFQPGGCSIGFRTCPSTIWPKCHWNNSLSKAALIPETPVFPDCIVHYHRTVLYIVAKFVQVIQLLSTMEIMQMHHDLSLTPLSEDLTNDKILQT